MAFTEDQKYSIIDFDKHILSNGLDRQEKVSAWQTAIGLQAVDGLQTSDYLKDTAVKHINGDISIDEARELIKSYYIANKLTKDEDTEEADKVSANIVKVLSEKSFAFSQIGLTSIHRKLFDGAFKFAGKIRDYNISKKEWALHGDTVIYVNAKDLRMAIDHDLKQEKPFSYKGLSQEEIVAHIAGFVSDLWQIHPFGEGNTRTTEVFTIKYLKSIGFNIYNDIFAEHSLYFRNALVRANYRNALKGVAPDMSFLILFFRNMLLGEYNALKNDGLPYANE